MSKAIEFLKSIGVPEQTITALESADDTTDLTNLVEDTESHFTNFYKEKVKDEIHKSAKGSAFAEAKTFAKKTFGLTEAEVKDLDLSAVFKLAHDRLSEKTGNKEATDQINTLRQAIIDYENKVKQYEEETIPGIKVEADNKVKSFKINSAIHGEVMKGTIVGSPGYVVPGFASDLIKTFKLDLDENDNVIATYPDGSKVFDKNKKELTFPELVVLHGKEKKIWAESNGNPTPTPSPVPPPTPTKAKNSREQWFQDAQKKVDEQKAKIGQ